MSDPNLAKIEVLGIGQAGADFSESLIRDIGGDMKNLSKVNLSAMELEQASLYLEKNQFQLHSPNVSKNSPLDT
jgi:hypothetical protein